AEHAGPACVAHLAVQRPLQSLPAAAQGELRHVAAKIDAAVRGYAGVGFGARDAQRFEIDDPAGPERRTPGNLQGAQYLRIDPQIELPACVGTPARRRD